MIIMIAANTQSIVVAGMLSLAFPISSGGLGGRIKLTIILIYPSMLIAVDRMSISAKTTCPAPIRALYIRSLLKNPPKGGTPSKCSSPIIMTRLVTGSSLPIPLILVMSLVPLFLMYIPLAMNSIVLPKLWFIMWRTTPVKAMATTA